jgi:transposase
MQSYLEGAYNKIPDQVRDKLVELVVVENLTIKDAATVLKLKYSTAKTIYKVFKKENRTFKCTTRSRCPEVPKEKIRKL